MNYSNRFNKCRNIENDEDGILCQWEKIDYLIYVVENLKVRLVSIVIGFFLGIFSCMIQVLFGLKKQIFLVLWKDVFVKLKKVNYRIL